MNEQFRKALPANAVDVPWSNDDPDARATQGLRELVDVLLRRKAWIIVTTALFLAAAVLFALVRGRDYVATTQLLIDPRGIQVVDRDLTPRAQTSDGGTAIVESQVDVLTSQSVLSKVIDQENLLDDPEFNGKGGGPVTVVKHKIRALVGPLIGAVPDPADPRIMALDALSEALAAGRPERSYVIELAVRTGDPDKSARIANAIAETYLDSEFAVRAGLARRASDSLEGRLDELRAAVRDAEDKVEQFKAEHNIVSSPAGLVNEQQLDQWNGELISARAATSAAEAKLDQIRALQASGALPETMPEAVLSDTIRQLRSQYTAARQREVALQARLLPGHPQMLEAAAQVRSVRADIRAEVERIADAAELDYNRALANQRELEAQLDGLKRTAFTTNDALVRMRELERDAEASRLIYQAFLVRARELSEQERVDTTDARVISKAIPPISPAGPSTALVFALALGSGLGLGGLLALGRETLDPTIRTAWQLRDASRLTVLATLPIRAEDGGDALPAFAAQHPAAPSSMAFHPIVQWLMQMPSAGEPRVALVTAASGAHGKATVALNLALAAAVRGHRVMLVDGDLARRALSTQRFDDPEIGLVSVLRGDVPLQSAIQRDPSGILRVLPAGLRSGRLFATRLAARRLFDTVFSGLDDVDLVVVDGAVAGNDRSLDAFAEIADAVLFVARSGVTNEHHVARAMRALGNHWTKLAGAILIVDAD